MIQKYFQIKDQCRSGLLQYLEEVSSLIPSPDIYRMLDIGCGTGVPALFMAGRFSGPITAIDLDKPALDFLQQKVNSGNFQDRIDVRNISFFDLEAEKQGFDLILAEGFLNVVGFEKGFQRVMDFLKPGGYFLIHDEFKDHEFKVELMERNGCRLIHSLCLDEGIWWNHYYHCLDMQIRENRDPELSEYFKSDVKEIGYYHTDPALFRSIYYLVIKN